MTSGSRCKLADGSAGSDGPSGDFGGVGGTGGWSGGASIAVFLRSASPTFNLCRFQTNNGGAGGLGGNGRLGGNGGYGGSGGSRVDLTVLGFGIAGGYGGSGGDGGFGGAGGAGAGGNGGPSIGVVRTAGSFPPSLSANGNLFTIASGGPPAAGGTHGNGQSQAPAGQVGPSANEITL